MDGWLMVFFAFVTWIWKTEEVAIKSGAACTAIVDSDGVMSGSVTRRGTVVRDE